MTAGDERETMTQNRYEEGTMKQLLIQAGIEELGKNGVQNFSLRRVASSCGVSCAAPYRHFKDKEAFLLAVIEYINDLWAWRHEEVLRATPGDVRQQLIATSMAYIHFLVDHPHVRSIIMMKDSDFGNRFTQSKSQLSARTQGLIRAYCDQVHIPKDVETYKTFVVRSIIYGAALMIDNGEIENCQKSYDYAEMIISREFDIGDGYHP